MTRLDIHRASERKLKFRLNYIRLPNSQKIKITTGKIYSPTVCLLTRAQILNLMSVNESTPKWSFTIHIQTESRLFLFLPMLLLQINTVHRYHQSYWHSSTSTPSYSLHRRRRTVLRRVPKLFNSRARMHCNNSHLVVICDSRLATHIIRPDRNQFRNRSAADCELNIAIVEARAENVNSSPIEDDGGAFWDCPIQNQLLQVLRQLFTALFRQWRE